MLLSKVVAAASFLLITINVIWAIPQPGIIRERHVIHTPIKVRVIHHYKIKKVPLIIKKHLHFYNDQEDIINYHPKPDLEDIHNESEPAVEDHSNDIYHHLHHQDDHHFDDDDDHFNFKTPHASYQQGHHHDLHEDDYEEHEQSKEEDEGDYEYE